MVERTEERLVALGLDAAAASRLAAAGALAGAEGADPLLPAAVAAAGDPHLFATALPALVGDLDRRTHELDEFERAVLRHLQALVAWRLEGDVPAATRALNRSIDLLLASDAACAASYVGRVFDSSGQLLQHQGLLVDARLDFERSLELKAACGDAAGAALTRGNLGRLCMELGDFDDAAEHLEGDLDYVVETAPEMTRLRGQLLTQIGVCRTELGERDEARRRLEASRDLATGSGDGVGLAFATVHLGRHALLGGDLEAAGRHARRVRELLAQVPEGVRAVLGALVVRLEAELEQARGNVAGALERFAEAAALFDGPARVSPVEHADLLQAWAHACEADGRTHEAAGLLRRALRHLDATTAEAMRGRIDARMKAVDESTWMLHSTGRFVGHGQIELLLSQAGQTGFQGSEEQVTVLFSDIRSFTSISEGLEPRVLVSVLNRYLTHMTRCVELFGGMVDKFIGDAVMALFSLPVNHEDDADRAVSAAAHMQTELARFNRTLPEDLPRLAAGIGLHSGKVVGGLIGSPQKRSYTVIGDAVNTASRLEGMTKMLGVPILVSAAVKEALVAPDRWLLEPFGAFRPKGRAGAVEVYHLAGTRDGSAHAREAALRIEAMEEALAHFRAGRFREARGAFEARGEGRGYALLARHAAELEVTSPPDDWDGSIELTEK